MVVAVQQPAFSVTGLLSLAEIRFMRGVGRTPRGLWAQQITSHAAGGTSRSVAPNHGQRAITKGSTQSQEASSHQAPKPLRPTDQDKRSVAPTQTGERSDGRPQSQLKNPSRQPTIQIPPAPLQRVHEKMGAQSHSQQDDKVHQQRQRQARARHTCTSKGGGGRRMDIGGGVIWI